MCVSYLIVINGGDSTMGDNKFYKVVAFDDNNVFEFKVEEDSNVGTLEDVHKFMDENIDKHPTCKWLLLPIM